MMEDKNTTNNVSGGQFNYARDQATITAIQNNGVSADELNKIVQGIINHLSGLEKEDAYCGYGQCRIDKSTAQSKQIEKLSIITVSNADGCERNTSISR